MSIPRHLLLGLTALTFLTVAPTLGDSTGQRYELATIDHRLAAAEVREICDRTATGRRCMVQVSSPGELIVFGPQKAHDAIQEMLDAEDLPLPTSVGFRIALVREGEEGDAGGEDPAEIMRAMEAVEEMLGLERLCVDDIGLIQLAERGSLRLADGDGKLYDVALSVLSILSRHRKLEITLEIEVHDASGAVSEDSTPIFSSVVTVSQGETIVAGSSRRKPANELFVMLLTSLPHTAGQRRPGG
jgi:hypothetical protein